MAAKVTRAASASPAITQPCAEPMVPSVAALTRHQATAAAPASARNQRTGPVPGCSARQQPSVAKAVGSGASSHTHACRPTYIAVLGDASTEDLIKGTKRGVLLTRTWYIRLVDPQTMLLTGLTRDGTFYIEDGEIKYPVKNFRFNESPVIMLNNIEALGKSVRLAGGGGGGGGGLLLKVPSMKVRDFTFTSLSDAV